MGKFLGCVVICEPAKLVLIMQEKNFPSNLHPSLTQERLSEIARIIRDVRHEVSTLHAPEKGDTPWSFGCRAYVRTCHAIAQEAQFKHRDWLQIIEDDGLHFVFAIGSVPLRFYRGLLDESNPRYRVRNSPELNAQQRAFAFHEDPTFRDLVLRLVVQADESGEARRISLVQLDSNGNPRHPYDVPFDPYEERIVRISRPKDGVDLRPADVGRPRQDKRKQNQSQNE